MSDASVGQYFRMTRRESDKISIIPGLGSHLRFSGVLDARLGESIASCVGRNDTIPWRGSMFVLCDFFDKRTPPLFAHGRTSASLRGRMPGSARPEGNIRFDSNETYELTNPSQAPILPAPKHKHILSMRSTTIPRSKIDDEEACPSLAFHTLEPKACDFGQGKVGSASIVWFYGKRQRMVHGYRSRSAVSL